ncbi:bud neck involved protein [Didymella heteroderae]|uniref:Bud neck involved protein n=1 Tax=Didymella heteroderae TaxID=1769908 RepID=A0A9P4WQY0_9PLEO|nr:bud neck involved protein [Didymella heteroderae]
MPYSPDNYQNAPSQPHQQRQHMQRNYSGQTGGTGYRGTSAPIAPYAFSSTPQLRQDNRSVSPPTPQAAQQQPPNRQQARLGHPSHPSSSSDSTVSTSGSSSRSLAQGSKDDSDIKPIGDFAGITLSTAIPDLTLSLDEAPVKASPGRYRRAAARTDSSASISTGGGSTPTATQRSSIASTPTNSTHDTSVGDNDLTPTGRPGHNRANSADNTLVQVGTQDSAKRYRRRSFAGVEGSNGQTITPTPIASVPVQTATPTAGRPESSSGRPSSRPASSHSHQRQGSIGSIQSSTSTRAAATGPATGNAAAKGTEPARRTAPSPLSQPISPPEQSNSQIGSEAMKHLAAVNEKDKGMKSRLRRAFSFGSAAELRRASAENAVAAERARLKKDKYQSDEDAEQAAIIAKQEAAGIGAGIYSGQGGMGSNDNLSIQSAASSASIMLRKMGSGMKKGTRSIKGLFRPKSVIGVPAADGPISRPSVGQVSMVSVEAERQKVNVNANAHDQVRGGTGYPRLERNSIDAGRTAEIVNADGSIDNDLGRKSIVGGDRERAEILSNMKKGILKRNGTNSDSGSPTMRPLDGPNPTFAINAPITPTHEKGKANSDDYFTKPPKITNGSTRSLPVTPAAGRNISFSPRIQFHDAWSPHDYDRRGDIATCNRLTPMLAQQIKEELNSFKMEMEVHELSKPHTHFF